MNEQPIVPRSIALVAGPLAAVLLYLLLPDQGLTQEGRLTIAIGAWMAVWWLTEPIAIEATALLPLGLFPLAGVGTMSQTAAPYANEVIYLFLGGMLLGAAMEKARLHKRIALRVLLAVGTGPRQLLAGIMLATALISMWVSNTATAVMMLPIAVGVIAFVTGKAQAMPGSEAEHGRAARNFATAAVLGVASDMVREGEGRRGRRVSKPGILSAPVRGT